MVSEKRFADAIIYVLAKIESLMDKDMLEGPHIITAEGKARADQLDAEGFAPTQDEIQHAVAYILSGALMDDIETVTNEKLH